MARAVLVLVLVGRTASAAPPTPVEREVVQLRAKVAELEESRDQALRQLEDLRGTVEGLSAQMRAVRGAPPPAGPGAAKAGPLAVPAVATGAAAAGGTTRLAQADGGGSLEDQSVGTDKADDRRYSAERVILERQGGVLLPPGQLVIEPGFQYTNTSRNLLDVSGFFPIPGLVFGRIETDAINRDFYTSSLDLRYGLHRRVELSFSMPYSFRSDRSERDLGGSNEDIERVSDSGIGDIQFGLTTQLLYARKWWPDLTFSLLAKAPTGDDPFEITAEQFAFGSGTWGVNTGVTFVRALDPAVVYGSFRYLWDIETEIQGFDVDLGDTFEYTAGLAFSLNERVAFTTLLQHSIVGRTRFEGQKIGGSDLNIARLFLGTSYRMSEVITANLNLGIGLTEDAPDFSIELSFPLRMPWELPHL